MRGNRLVQNAGEFVVTFPGSYHSGFNHGEHSQQLTSLKSLLLYAIFLSDALFTQLCLSNSCQCQLFSVLIYTELVMS